MSLIRLDELSLAFGDRSIFSQVNLAIEPSERLCVVGRNGAGKSTLLGILEGTIVGDSGEVTRISHLQVASLAQALPSTLYKSVPDVIAEGLTQLLQLHQRIAQLASHPVDNAAELATLHARLDALDGWHPQQHIEKIITQLHLPKAKKLGELSGGLQRQVLLGRALVGKPDLLLLDEPTNHLDLATVQWLEKMLLDFRGCLVFITHDRVLANVLATRVIEIDRGNIKSWPGNFANYLRRKEDANVDEDTANALFDKRLAEEEAWIRKGIKARRTRNQGRVKALEDMRSIRAIRQKRPNRARIHIHAGEPSGRKIIEARGISAIRRQSTLFSQFSITIHRGERIGIVGNNGVGKSTLLKILLGDITPEKGSVKIGTNVRVGYFDQSKNQLHPNKNVIDNIGEGASYVQLGQKHRHVVGYLRDYLFDYKRLQTPLSVLSGGEKSRVLLAKIFSQPYNLLALDEPTNDLDVELLEALEEALCHYEGSLLVISHDRLFLDAVTTRIITFEDQGLSVHAGGYSDFIAKGGALAEPVESIQKTKEANTSITTKATKTAKFGYKQQRELALLPQQIEALEQLIAKLEATTNNVDRHEIGNHYHTIAQHQEQLEQLIQRWYYLSEIQKG